MLNPARNEPSASIPATGKGFREIPKSRYILAVKDGQNPISISFIFSTYPIFRTRISAERDLFLWQIITFSMDIIKKRIQ